ncbi:MAG: hypothetical protein WC815_11695 [Vicinamibacterales bacterium]|jgi:hypothetical protein
MDAKRFVIGTLAGGIAVLATGYLIFAMPPFREFYADAMTSGSATGVQRDSPLLWAVALGALSYSALVTLAIGTRAGAVNIGAGIRIGALAGFLLWLTADLMFYGISNVGNLTSAVLDPLLELVPGAIAGGVIAAVVGKVR